MDIKKAHYVSVTGIVVKDGKYLIVKRSGSEKAFPNQWTVPGGKLETEDYIKHKKDTDVSWYNICEKVLKREILEEVGLEVKNIQYLTSLTFIRPDNIPVLVISLFADHDSGDIKLCNDLTEHAWVDLKQAKDYNLISGIYEEIEMLDKVLKGKKDLRESEWKKD